MAIELSEVGIAILQETNDIAEMLIIKNRDYGNSVFEPLGVFSMLPAIEQIKARIDDKLKRIKNDSEKAFIEDTEKDLIGYLILKRVYYRLQKQGLVK